jgi:hypothetical protein
VAETSFPVAGGAGVTDAAYERLMGPITGSGRYAFNPTTAAYSTPLIFADNSGRQVKAYANQSAIVRGFRWESGTTPPVLSLDANTSGNPRLDLIVLRLDRSNYTVRLGKTKGTPAAVPAAPAPVQDTGTSGVWELPVATVAVASSGTTGQPFIQTTDVTATDWWLAPPPIILRNGSGIPTTMPAGTQAYRMDNNRSYVTNGTGYSLLGEDGALTKITAASSFTSDSIYARRTNGWTSLQATVVLNIADRPANTDLSLCTLPADFRPQNDIWVTVAMSPGQVGWGFITASTGLLTVTAYPQTFPKGGRLVVHPVTYPNA